MDKNEKKMESGEIRSGIYKSERDIANLLSTELLNQLDAKDGFEIEQEVKLFPTRRDSVIFDIVVRKDKYITTVIEVQRDYQTASWAGVFMPYYVFKHTQAPLCIVYCDENQSFYVFNRKKIKAEDNGLNFYDGDRLINDRYEKKEIKGLDNVIKCIKEESEKFISKVKNLDNQLDLRFYEEKVLDPQWCREQLGDFKDEMICRYSSLDSLFSTLKYGTFRMNGLPGMNDKDEGLFAWNMINKPENLRPELPEEININKRKSLINNAFIISYSYKNKIDDLIQWRLYGDDAKGVCCVYSVIKDRIKDRFFLHPIKYIESPKDEEKPTNNLLNKLKHYVDLKYADVSPVIFFYKHKDYEPEGEVRLLVDNKKTSAYKSSEYKREWVLTNSNNIPNPYIDIPIKEFPLKLEKIILGPNINEISTIQVQLETMLNQLGIIADVVPSRITSYRNPINKS